MPAAQRENAIAVTVRTAMTAWILEVIKPNEMYVPKAVYIALKISKDIVYRHIVCLPGVSGNRNAKGTHRSSILIPGAVVLVWYYYSLLNRR
jgi:hypothetical protein